MEDTGPGEDPLYEVGEVDASNESQKIPSAKSRKRASRACLPCRSRKVRCIVTSSREPCINCRLDEKECVFVARSKMVRGSARHAAGALGANTSLAVPTHDNGKALDEDSISSSTDDPPPLADDPMSVEIDPHELPTSLNDYTHEAFDNLATASFPTAFQDLPALDSPWTPQDGAQRLLFDPTNPDYCILEAPKVKALSPEDLDYLFKQGCFVVPQRKILNEFVQQYFLRLHPMLPILNEADFWALYLPDESNEQSGEKLPLIVLQSILFTACSFVSWNTIETLGFKSVHDAKSSFYKRAKLIYDFGLETSSISISQAALLLSQSHLTSLPHWDSKQLGTMWLAIAIHYARDAGAHRYHSIVSNASQTSPKQKKHHNTLKRLWWCCVIRDRLMPLTSRRTIKITNANFNFSGSPVLGSADLAEEFDKSRVYDVGTKKFLAEILAKLVELCVVLTEVLTLTFPMYDDPPRASSHPHTQETRIGDCRMSLRRWYSTVLRIRSIQGGELMKEAEAAESPKNSIVLFMNLLEMYYHSARMALCHYEILYSSLSAPSLYLTRSPTEAHENSHELQSAVSQVTQCLRKLVRLRLARWLPISAIGCTAFPLALQILDVKLFNSTHTPTREAHNIPLFAQHKQQQLNILIEAMKTYRPRYDGVDWVAKSVRFIVDLAQKHLPLLGGRNDCPISSWTELLQLYPNYYLRLAMTMDLSIRNGKIPEENDFPQSLRGIFEANSMMDPISSILMPRIDLHHEADFHHKLLEQQRRQSGDSGVMPGAQDVVSGMNEEMMGDGAGWEMPGNGLSISPKSMELGIDPLILEFGFEAGILSPLMDIEFGGEDAAKTGSGCETSSVQWSTGMPNFETTGASRGNQGSGLENFLEGQ